MSAVGVTWAPLVDAALGAVGRGWPVVPGTFRSSSGHWHGRAGASELRPLDDTWEIAPIIDAGQARARWSHKPFGVLLVCGRGVDVLEVPSAVTGLRPILADQGLTMPIAVLPAPTRRLRFVATGSGKLRTGLASASVRLLSAGNWAPLPPTSLGPARARWTEPPVQGREACLPSAEVVQDGLAVVLSSGPPDGDRG